MTHHDLEPTLLIDPQNLGSIALAGKAGFVFHSRVKDQMLFMPCRALWSRQPTLGSATCAWPDPSMANAGGRGPARLPDLLPAVGSEWYSPGTKLKAATR